MLNCLFIILAYIVFILICGIRYATIHLLVDLNVTSFNQILYNMSISQESAAGDVIEEALTGFAEAYGAPVSIMGLLCLIGCGISLFYSFQNKKEKQKPDPDLHTLKHMIRSLGAISLSLLTGFSITFVIQAHSSLEALGYYKYVEQQGTSTNFYEEYYINPLLTRTTFPDQKKNLIYIYLESMEISYADTKNGGAYETNYIPNLTKLALNNTCFSDGKTLNGAYTTSNATWTIAGMVAQTSATPLVYVDEHSKNTGNTNYWEDEDIFLEGVTTLGDLLEKNGYVNTLMVGSLGEYAGRTNYFKQHGSYTVLDYDYLNENNYLPYKDYYEFWGADDQFLLEAAKDKLTELAKGDEPFNLTLLTVDTHFPHGYLCDLCEMKEDQPQMKTVFSCSDRQISNLVSWIQKQDFAKDTVIVLAGDHYSMSADINAELSEYDRKTYISIINGPEYTQGKRTFTTLDLFPTTLAALGCQIAGNRLGLGTNLYSDTPTLAEELSIDVLNEEIPMSSDYYIHEILKIPYSQTDQEG